MSTLSWSTPVKNSVLNVKALVGTFNQDKALVGAFSVIVRCPLYLWRLPSWAMVLWAAHCSARRELLAPASHALEHTLWLAVQYSTVQYSTVQYSTAGSWPLPCTRWNTHSG